MPSFAYQAVSTGGKRSKGVIEAPSQRDAMLRLTEQQLTIVRIRPKATLSLRKPVKKQTIVDVIHQLAQLLRAGLPVYEALTALEEQYRGEPVQAVLADLCSSIRSGHSLSQGLRRHPKLFNSLTCAMIGAGEASGTLPGLLERLGDLMTRQEKTRKGLTTALIYPAILAGFCSIVVTGLLAFAIPSLEVLLEGRSVNTWTQIIFGLSHLVTGWWAPMLAGFAALVFLGLLWLRRDENRQRLYRIVVRLPMLRTLFLRAALARFTRTLGTLLQGGVPLAQALPLAREVLGHPILEPLVAQIETRITEGRSFGAELARMSEFPRLLSRMVVVGEESGELAQMLHHCGTLYENELEKSLARVSALAQPVVLILMGGIVASIMIGVLLPITDLSGIGGM